MKEKKEEVLSLHNGKNGGRERQWKTIKGLRLVPLNLDFIGWEDRDLYGEGLFIGGSRSRVELADISEDGNESRGRVLMIGQLEAKGVGVQELIEAWHWILVLRQRISKWLRRIHGVNDDMAMNAGIFVVYIYIYISMCLSVYVSLCMYMHMEN